MDPVTFGAEIGFTLLNTDFELDCTLKYTSKTIIEQK
jgi:hypothetical protein